MPIAPLQAALQRRAETATKDWWEGYVKGSAPFRGVGMATVREEVGRWRDTCIEGSPTAVGWVGTAMELIRQKHTEDKLAGILLLAETLAPAGMLRPGRDLPRFGSLFTDGHLADWNVVDWFCVKVLGPQIRDEGAAWADPVSGWRRAPNLWRARASLVPFTIVASERRYDGSVRESCAVLLAREERFAKTAAGWAVREICRHDPAVARSIIEEHLAAFSLEALRNATKHLPEPLRDRYIQRWKKH